MPQPPVYICFPVPRYCFVPITWLTAPIRLATRDLTRRVVITIALARKPQPPSSIDSHRRCIAYRDDITDALYPTRSIKVGRPAYTESPLGRKLSEVLRKRLLVIAQGEKVDSIRWLILTRYSYPVVCSLLSPRRKENQKGEQRPLAASVNYL